MTKRPIIIDCDPGIDDAVALSLAFAARDELDILAITTVAGNVPLDLTARNARIMRELAGREDVPVFAGCALPILREPVFAEEFHGKTGLEGIEIFEPRAPLGDAHAVQKIVDFVRASPEPVQLIATGPLTNVAAALTLAPEITGNISELVIMGGADTEGGNITPHAEFNIFADPHAAQIVFQKQFDAALPITVFSLDFTHTVHITPERIDAVRGCAGKLAGHAANLLVAINAFEKQMVGADTGPLHDPCTIAYVLKPDGFEAASIGVYVDTEPGETFGKTRPSEGDNIRWVTPARGQPDAEMIFDLLVDRIGSYG